MTRYGFVYLLLGSLSLGQVASSQSQPAAHNAATPTTAAPKATDSGQSQQAKALSVGPDMPVITINGLCDDLSSDRNGASNCKTVITRTQFEEVIAAVQPNMSAKARREFALRYADALVTTKKAEEMGLDKGANFEEQMKLARIQILSKALNKAIQEKVSQISDQDIEVYYHNNKARFEQAEMDRIYVPKARHAAAASDKTSSDADGQQHSQELEQMMKNEAENLRARAVAGEEFAKLQADAYRVAGIKSAAPNTNIKVRRMSLPPNQVSAMDLNPGEVSSVLADPNGYIFYKVKDKDMLPLDRAREEIRAILRSERIQNEMRGIEDAATSILDESYFRPSRSPQGVRAGEMVKPASNNKPD